MNTDLADADTLVAGDLLAAPWVARPTSLGTAPSLRRVLGAGDLTEVNPGGNAPTASAYLEHPFVAPAGCSSVRFAIPLAGLAGPTRVVLELYNPTSGVTVSTGFDLTAAVSVAAITIAATSGQICHARLWVHNHPTVTGVAQARVVAGRARVTSTGGTGVFAARWTRFGALPDVLRDTVRTTPGTAGFDAVVHATPYSRMVLETDAASMAVEVYGEMPTGVYPPATVAVNVAGAAQPTLAITTGRQLYVVALPGSGVRRVEIVASYQQILSGDQGNFLAAIYLPRTATTTVRRDADDPPSKRRRVCLVGDSILAGYPVSAGGVAQPDAVLGAPATVLRTRGYQVTSETVGGTALRGVAGDASARSALVARIVASRPDDVWIALGANDWGSGGAANWTAAAYGAALGALVDTVARALPTARIWCASAATIATEGTPGVSGDTIALFRDAVADVAAARSGVRLVSGTTLGTVSDLSGDGVHHTPAGVAAYAGRLADTLDAA